MNTTASQNWLIPTVYGNNAEGIREELMVSDSQYYDYEKETRKYTVTAVDITHSNKWLALKVNEQIYQNPKYSTLKVYEGKYDSITDAKNAVEITDKIFAADMTQNLSLIHI